MEEKENPAPESTRDRLRDLDRRYFCFYKRRAVLVMRSRIVIQMREQIDCCCPNHNIRFTYLFN